MASAQTTRPRPKLLPRAERRDALLTAAATAFARSGFAHTSMDDVAAKAGVTKLIVYRHFASKEELYRAVLERVFERQAHEFLTRLETGGPGIASGAMLTVAREWPDGFRLLWRHAAREPQFADYANELRDTAVGAARELVTSLGIEPAFREWAAQTLFDGVVDAVLNWLDHGSPGRDDEFVERSTAFLRAATFSLVNP
jgi:AcrR family transcriptional regulator